MNSNEYINYWLKGAEHDLETAEALFRAKKYDWCLFLGHLVLEKTLKALWVKNNDYKVPPKTHNLVKLAEETALPITQTIKLQLFDINDFNIEARYPDYKLQFYKRCTKSFTARHFTAIKELYVWLKKQM
jgi:HEPN domain-containing protein